MICLWAASRIRLSVGGVFGLGGIYVELFKDVANVLCPAEAESVLARL